MGRTSGCDTTAQKRSWQEAPSNCGGRLVRLTGLNAALVSDTTAGLDEEAHKLVLGTWQCKLPRDDDVIQIALIPDAGALQEIGRANLVRRTIGDLAYRIPEGSLPTAPEPMEFAETLQEFAGEDQSKALAEHREPMQERLEGPPRGGAA